MKYEDFNTIINDQVQFSLNLLTKKGEEYAEDAVQGTDRLSHFKKHANLLNSTQEAAIFSMLCKHIVSLADMVAHDNMYPVEQWTEKISDSINYLLILKAAVIEDFQEEL